MFLRHTRASVLLVIAITAALIGGEGTVAHAEGLSRDVPIEGAEPGDPTQVVTEASVAPTLSPVPLPPGDFSEVPDPDPVPPVPAASAAPDLGSSASGLDDFDPAAASVVSRTEFDITYEKADGSMVTVMSAEPVNVRDGGSWVPIDTEVKTSGAWSWLGIGEALVENHPLSPVFAQSAGDDVLTLTRGEHSLGFRLRDAAESPLVRDAVGSLLQARERSGERIVRDRSGFWLGILVALVGGAGFFALQLMRGLANGADLGSALGLAGALILTVVPGVLVVFAIIALIGGWGRRRSVLLRSRAYASVSPVFATEDVRFGVQSLDRATAGPLPYGLTITADHHGISVWAGHRSPRSVLDLSWGEIQEVTHGSSKSGLDTFEAITLRVPSTHGLVSLCFPLLGSFPFQARPATAEAADIAVRELELLRARSSL